MLITRVNYSGKVASRASVDSMSRRGAIRTGAAARVVGGGVAVPIRKALRGISPQAAEDGPESC